MSLSPQQLDAQIAALYVYPVKSCGGVSVTSVPVYDTGLDLDRAWMVVDEHGEFMSQRELPRMALIQPRIRHSDVVLRAPGMLALHISVNEVEAPARVRVWNDEVPAFDMGNTAAQWLTDFLGQPLRLVRFDPDQRRLSDRAWTGSLDAPNQFSDGFPFLVVGDGSIAGLNERLVRAGHSAVGADRFRPNIVLSGLQAHDEDRVESLRLVSADASAGLELRLVKPCARCSIPNVNPLDASIHPGVTDALAAYRSDPRVRGALSFGMNAVLVSGEGASLRVGDRMLGDWKF